MNDYLKKIKRAKLLRNIVLVFTVAVILVYIGVEPYLVKAYGSEAPFQLIIFIMVALALFILFTYESAYSKSEKFLEDVLFEVQDAGYYKSAREIKDVDGYAEAVISDLTASAFKVNKNITSQELEFDFCALKGGEYIYAVCLDTSDKNDIIAYTDSALYDLLSVKMKSKGNALVIFICNNAEESAVALSKRVQQSVSGKRILKCGVAIVEAPSGKVYFRGNETGVLQKLAVQYVIGSELPLDEKYISFERLPFQLELEESLADFNIKDFKKGKYFER